MDMEVNWMPQSLYSCAVAVIANGFPRFVTAVRSLPRNLQFEIYQKLHEQGRICVLCSELCDLDVFSRLLRVPDKRLVLHQCFQAIRDHGVKISQVLSELYRHRVSTTMDSRTTNCKSLIVLGFQLGGFLSDAGWNRDSATAFSSCFQLCQYADDLEKAFYCCTKLLHVYNANCRYKEAERQFLEAQDLFKRLHERNPDKIINFASLFAEYGAYHFAKSEYDKAYRWSIEALKMLKAPGFLSEMTVIDVLRLASKACVVKRQFSAAERLVRHAVILSRDIFGPNHPKYSSTLLDYGFYLLNVDNVCQSQKVYLTALAIRQSVFGGQNLHVAIAHEDLAYASYVHQYSTGRFEDSRSHADAAINILSKILRPDHLLLASSNRVKALILEEIAIDSQDRDHQRSLLDESHQLHLQSLELAQKAFGERNVQTAKHYGNLGRLYQSMEKYEKAEEMHLKAISIKEELLGPQDYEVALSVGHLASLYNYDLKQYDKAEKLYLRSIAIAKRLFGEGYSGLEYDYRGLIKLYSRLGDFEKVIEYDHVLSHWNVIREQRSENADTELQNFVNPTLQSHTPIEIRLEDTGVVIDDFFSKIHSDTKATPEKRLEEVFAPPRSHSDIAFGGPLTNYPQRGAARGNDHRNVGDSTFSHPAVSVFGDSGSSTSRDEDPHSSLEQDFLQYDKDMVQALRLFLVGNKTTKFSKAKAE